MQPGCSPFRDSSWMLHQPDTAQRRRSWKHQGHEQQALCCHWLGRGSVWQKAIREGVTPPAAQFPIPASLGSAHAPSSRSSRRHVSNGRCLKPADPLSNRVVQSPHTSDTPRAGQQTHRSAMLWRRTMRHFSQWPSSTPVAACVPAVHVSCTGRLQPHRFAGGEGPPRRYWSITKTSDAESNRGGKGCARRGFEDPTSVYALRTARRRESSRAGEASVLSDTRGTSIKIRGLRR